MRLFLHIEDKKNLRQGFSIILNPHSLTTKPVELLLRSSEILNYCDKKKNVYLVLVRKTEDIERKTVSILCVYTQ